LIVRQRRELIRKLPVIIFRGADDCGRLAGGALFVDLRRQGRTSRRAKARRHSLHLSARLKSCPFKAGLWKGLALFLPTHRKKRDGWGTERLLNRRASETGRGFWYSNGEESRSCTLLPRSSWFRSSWLFSLRAFGLAPARRKMGLRIIDRTAGAVTARLIRHSWRRRISSTPCRGIFKLNVLLPSYTDSGCREQSA